MAPEGNLVASITAIEDRRGLADPVFAQVREALPDGRAAIFYSAMPWHAVNAGENTRAALEFALSLSSDWHLFLQDDQVLYPAFWTLLPRLLEVAEVRGIEAFYLANRQIRYASQEIIGGIVMNHLPVRVDGAHGLLYRSRNTPRWLDEVQGDIAAPIDDTFWRAIAPAGQRPLVYQIVAPILAQHVGVKSTLHTYYSNAHLLLNSIEPDLLTRLRT